jgi:hypothetical protein
LRDLIAHPEKRREIGRAEQGVCCEMAFRTAAGRRFDQIYSAACKAILCFGIGIRFSMERSSDRFCITLRERQQDICGAA